MNDEITDGARGTTYSVWWSCMGGVVWRSRCIINKGNDIIRISDQNPK